MWPCSIIYCQPIQAVTMDDRCSTKGSASLLLLTSDALTSPQERAETRSKPLEQALEVVVSHKQCNLHAGGRRRATSACTSACLACVSKTHDSLRTRQCTRHGGRMASTKTVSTRAMLAAAGGGEFGGQQRP